ncbi:MAG: carboxypeptidase regulatory-like domain-containing protein [Longimicrobiales bacterium]
MRTATPMLLAFAILLVPPHAAAQVVRGQLLNGETGLPLEGAMIVLQGPSGELGTVLSNATGRFILQAPGPGTYSIRADRIGHASTTSDLFRLSSGDTVDIRLVAEVRAIELEALEVSGERRCEVRPESGRAVATVWEEARKALSAAALTDETGVYRYRTIRFLRDLDDRGRRVLSEQRRASQGYQAAPFESLPAETLVTEGFFRPDPEGDLYFAPDAKVLLSDEFLDTHCLGLTPGRGETTGLLGVAFEPIPGRDLPEIRGVVWVDPVANELRHVDYSYENLDPDLRSDAVGGRVVFQGLPNGTWIVREWRIRMPTAGQVPDYRGGRRVTLAGIREVGGEVARVEDQGGRIVLQAERATLSGVVLDETGIEPLAGATVRIVGTQSSAVTGPDGSFTLPGLSEGVYAVGFSHPSLPTLAGFPEPVEVELESGRVVSVRMVAPSPTQILAAACGDEEPPEGSTVLTGLVTDGETGEPIPGAVVRVLWTGYRFRGTGVARGGEGRFQTLMAMQGEGLQGQTDASGRYLACTVPGDHPLRVEAEMDNLSSEILSVRIPPETEFFQQDLSILRSGTGSVVGSVVDWETREPLEGVTVTLGTPDRGTLTDENGRFLLAGVPLGKHPLSAEILGRATLRDSIRVRPGEPLQLELRLPVEALQIEGVTVEVLSQGERDFRQEGFSGGRFDRITPEEMDVIRDRVTDVVDVLQKTGSPRIRVTDYTTGGVPMGFCIRWTRRELSEGGALTRAAEAEERGTVPGCTSMLIVVDGIPQEDVGGGGPTIPATEFLLDLSPEDIESVRILSPVQARFQYGAQGDRGALLIETRKGGR